MDEFSMPKDISEYVFEEKKSEFISTIFPVRTEIDAVNFVSSIKSKYPDARHNVYAYYILENNVEIKRYSDDGEPKGTGGVPVLEAIVKSGLINCAIVVTRYFGGILLGSSGLTRAYSNAASGVLTNCKKETYSLGNKFLVTCDYNSSGKIRHFSEDNFNFEIKNTDFSEVVNFEIIVKKNYCEEFLNKIKDLTCGKAEIISDSQGFYPFSERQI